MSALEGLKNSIRRWGGSDDDESYSNELESAQVLPLQIQARLRATQTSLNLQRKNLCRRFLHAARHRLQTQIRYTLIMQAQLCTLL